MLAQVVFGAGVVALVLAAIFVFAPKGWRTVIFNGLAAVAVVLPDLMTQLAGVDWPSLLGEKYGPFAAATFALGNILLRFSTTTAIGCKE